MIRMIEISHETGIEMVSVENDAIDLEAYVEDRYPGAAFALVSEAVLLDRLKAELKRRVDEKAEAERLRYITAGAGQAMTYAQKAEEARLCLAANGPDPEDYPLLAAEIGITAATLVGVAQVVATANSQWLQIGAAIEAARLSGKRAISDAATEEDAQAAATAVVWPST